MLPTLEQVTDQTVGQVAAQVYSGMTYDHALPIEFAHAHPDLVTSTVWIYPEGSIMGLPAPITAECAITLFCRGVVYFNVEGIAA